MTNIVNFNYFRQRKATREALNVLDETVQEMLDSDDPNKWYMLKDLLPEYAAQKLDIEQQLDPSEENAHKTAEHIRSVSTQLYWKILNFERD